MNKKIKAVTGRTRSTTKSAEVWKRIEGFPDYKISNLGNVYNLKRQKFQNCVLCKVGTEESHVYRMRVCLINEEGAYHMYVARLVARHFLKRGYSLDVAVTFKDGDVSNPASDNLEYSTVRRQPNY